jgi:hypothetical protein
MLSCKGVRKLRQATAMEYAYRAALLLMDERITIIVLNSKAKTSRINVPVSPDEESTEDGLSQKVQYTVENGFRVGRDEVASLADAPCNWVQDPWKTDVSTILAVVCLATYRGMQS